MTIVEKWWRADDSDEDDASPDYPDDNEGGV